MPLDVRITDLDGNRIGNVQVPFNTPARSASALLSATSVNPDASGLASVIATADSHQGTCTAAAQTSDVVAAPGFSRTHVIDTADRIFADGFDPLAGGGKR